MAYLLLECSLHFLLETIYSLWIPKFRCSLLVIVHCTKSEIHDFKSLLTRKFRLLHAKRVKIAPLVRFQNNNGKRNRNENEVVTNE